MTSRHPNAQHLGYSPSKLASSPSTRLYKTDVSPLAEHAKDTLLLGAQPCELFPVVKPARAIHMFRHSHA